MRGAQGAAEASAFDQRWTPGARRSAATTRTNGDPVVGSNNVTAHRLRFRRRHGLSLHARHHCRLCARRRRHQLGPGAGLGGGRSDAFQAGVYGKRMPARLPRRRARLHRSLDDHRPHRARRSAHREVRRAKLRRPPRSRLSLLRRCRRCRRHALRGGAGAVLPYPELQRDRSHRRRLRAVLWRHDRAPTRAANWARASTI